ncbi:MAG: NADH-quinone oxidoreductase subunit L [Actinomycetota bacterium]|nr:NADH-quinone oxidoreductase subunit L [Actinomycetota bacterium]
MSSFTTSWLAAVEEGGHAGEEIARFVGDAPWMLENAWLFPAVPFVSFVLILFLGKRLPFKGAEIGITSVGATFVMALVAAGQWIDLREGGSSEGEHAAGLAGLLPFVEGGEEGHSATGAVVNTMTWWQSGGIEFNVGTMVDGLAIMMLFVVTLVSLLVHVYSTDYVHGDRRYTHFFAFLSLFTASMLLLVVSEGVVQMITAWELVGVCSFSLIGHWWEEQPNSDAALKAFFTNRVGDVGLLVGMIILFFTAGHAESFSIIDINMGALDGSASHTALLVAALCLTAAVMSKSGQFFLHTWLPDAMAGPTPVSALIHAATMVVAGVFMIARLYPVFWEGYAIPDNSLNFLAWTGALTTLVGGSLAFVQRDIKKVLAYSTVSQLGYMVLALGVGAWTAGVFHLFTHAFFKACLFLGAGSVSHAVHHSFDMKADMGGLRKYMPQTFATFAIASVALAGIPPLAGFWSKDEILAGTGSFPGTDGNGTYHAMLIMGGITALLTAAYMTRCVYLTFFGEYRGHAHPHESGPRLVVPLWILAGLAVVVGFLNLPGDIADSIGAPAHKFEDWVEPAGAAYFPPIGHASFSFPLAAISTLLALSGVAVGYWYYFVKVDRLGNNATELPNGLTSRSRLAKLGYTILENKYYLDWLYTTVIVGFVKGPLARATNRFNQVALDGIVNGVATVSRRAAYYLYNYFDQLVVDGIVNGSGSGAEESGQVLRKIQTGRVQQYAALMFAGATVLAGMFILFV